jgi:AraC-like DNA-binding protein
MTGARPAGFALRLILPMATALDTLRLDSAAFSARLGIGVDVARTDDARVPSARVVAALDELAASSGQANLGLAIGQVMPLMSITGMHLAVQTSPTLRASLQRLVRFYDHYGTGTTMSLDEVGEVAELVWTFQGRRLPNRHLVELGVATAARGIRDALSGAVAFRSVHFAHSAPADVRMHHAVFGAPVLFDQPRTKLVMDGAALDRRPIASDEAFAAAIDAELVKRAHQESTGDPLAERVRAVVAASLREADQGLDAAARALAVSRRTLQRRLASRGTSFQEIVDAVRENRAKGLLQAGLSSREIAAALGFANPGALYRAYRRWTGQTLAETRGTRGSSPTDDE